MDLHLHTPASEDYLQPEIGYLDILKQAASKGLDIIAFTDHNTVAGYRRMMEEIDQLKLLQQLKRLLPEEETRLAEYQKLLNRVLVLPGFEFTATFGFHILAIFPEDKPVRDIEHLLLELNIPSEKVDQGSITVGASVDVLTAYKAIRTAGGMAIAAHANSNNGVAMRRFPFGGQTKIAYTQDPDLFAL
ncbi:MAG TPA: PHP domain-containing protein, partial [Chloroflexi bacterium]|nr:PHP domain-containing protein [Chloroflexota bacterium]